MILKIKETFEYEVEDAHSLEEVFTIKDCVECVNDMPTPFWDGEKFGIITNHNIEVIHQTIETVDEVIHLIETNVLYSLDDADDLIKQYNLKKVASGLELNSHRWYSDAINVYECVDGFVGVWGLFQSFSEQQSIQDCDVICEAFPMEEISTVTYKIIHERT